MFKRSITKCIFLLSLYSTANTLKHVELPSFIERCKIYDPKVSDCLLKATETVKPYLLKGIPELKLPPIEPFIISELTLEQEFGALNFTAVLKDVKVMGLSSYKFSKFDFDVPNLQWFTNWTLDFIKIEGGFSVLGTVLGSAIKGNGDFVAGVDNLKVHTYQRAKKVQKGGLDYIHPVNTTVNFTAENPRFQFTGLLGEDEDSNKFINNLIQNNLNDLFQDMKPLIERITAKVGEEWLVKHLEGIVPFENLYIHK